MALATPDWRLRRTRIFTIPIIIEKNKSRLCAKELVGNRNEMSKSQDLFFDLVGSKFGLERGVNGLDKPIKKRLSELEYQKKVVEEKNEILRNELIYNSELNQKLISSIKKLEFYFDKIKFVKYLESNYKDIYMALRKEFERTLSIINKQHSYEKER